MNRKVEIYFEQLCDNAFIFVITDQSEEFPIDESNFCEVVDTVRIDERLLITSKVQEALTFYNFWMDLKRLVGVDRPKLVCNNLDLLVKLHEMYRRSTLLLDDPWLFHGDRSHEGEAE